LALKDSPGQEAAALALLRCWRQGAETAQTAIAAAQALAVAAPLVLALSALRARETAAIEAIALGR